MDHQRDISEKLQVENNLLTMQLAHNLCRAITSNESDEQAADCEACGDKPATRVIHDFDEIPSAVAGWLEPEDGPWYLCDEHADGTGEPLTD